MSKIVASLLLICLFPVAAAQQAAAPSIEELEKLLQKKQSDQDAAEEKRRAAEQEAEATRAREAAEKQRQREAAQYRNQPDVSISGLPREVQADMLQKRITQALARGDDAVAMGALDQYRKLGLTPALSLVYGEALAAQRNEDAIRALAALEEFLRRTPRNGRQYDDALAMYPEYKAKADAALVFARQAELRARADMLLVKAQRLIIERKFADAQYPVALFLEKPNPAKVALAQNLQQQISAGIDAKSRELVPDLVAELAFTTVPKGSLSKSKKEDNPAPVESFRLSTASVNFNIFKIYCDNVYDYGTDSSSHMLRWREWHKKNDINAHISGYCGNSFNYSTAQKIVAWLNQYSGRNFRLPTIEEWTRVFAGGLPSGDHENAGERQKEIERRRTREFGKTFAWLASSDSLCTDSRGVSLSSWIDPKRGSPFECEWIFLVEP